MTETLPLFYTDVELESYLPSGWTLVAGEEPVWEEEGGDFRFRALDSCEMEWEIVVPKKEVDEHGRIEALRRAVDRLFRERFKSIL